MNFEFATASRIVFGRGSLAGARAYLGAFGRRALVVTGSTPARAQPLFELLKQLDIGSETLSVKGEPSVETALQGVDLGRKMKAEFVVGVGGGSALDAGKAIAALLANQGSPLDYLEVIGAGKKLQHPALPMIAIPTTSGTGSEVTKNAVLASEEHRVKVSLRDNSMLPDIALVDSELTHGVPKDVTAATGLDALTQCIEPFVSRLNNPLTDGFALTGIKAGARHLERAYSNGDDAEAREQMALTSLCGGLALANAKLGAVHGLAGPLGGMFPAPHGAICARLLPLVMAENLRALRARSPQNPLLTRFDVVAITLTSNVNARAEEGIAWLEALVDTLRVPGLASYGLTKNEIPNLVEKAQRSSSMKGNPLELSREELAGIAERAL
jgi:alcohol dehydrogenase class IV